jgi:ketosteroid isomerase-like protein
MITTITGRCIVLALRPLFGWIAGGTVFCSLFAGPLASTQGAANSPEARIDRVRQEFNRCYSAGNAAALAALLSEDAVWMPPGEPAIVGRDAIRARYEAQFATSQSVFTLNRGPIRVSGNLAWLWSDYERIDTPIEGDLCQVISGKYVMTFRREGADWKITSDTWNADETPLHVDAQIALNGLRALTKWRLRDVAGTLRLLASTAEVKSGDWNTMAGLLARLEDAGILANAIWFVQPDGYYYTVELGFTGLNLSDRSYFPGLLAGEGVLGTLVISRSTGKRSVIIAEPVFYGAQIIGAVGVSYSVDQLSLEIDEQIGLPARVIFYALDTEGQTALHRDPTLMFEYPSDMGSPTLSSAVEEMLSRESGVVTYVFRDLRKTVLFERSSILGWVFALGFSEPDLPGMD